MATSNFNGDDILSLPSPSLLDLLTFLETRYLTHHQTYTSLGRLLLSLTPATTSTASTASTLPTSPSVDDIQTTYHPSKELSQMPSHIWKLASNVVRKLLNEKEYEVNDDSHHTIYFTGRCGSGKTENMKLIIQYLSYFCYSMSSMKISPPNIQLRIQTISSLLNPFIEAVHGPYLNSTRCGTHLRFLYDTKFNFHGIYLDIFGLEAMRVVDLSQNNFHIFYMICCEESVEKREKYHIQDHQYYAFLKDIHDTSSSSSFSTATASAALSNVSQYEFYRLKYQQFLSSLDHLTKDSDLVMDGLMRTIMAILTIGNIDFDSLPPSCDEEDLSMSDKQLEMKRLFGIVAELLEIDLTDLINTLTTRTVVISLESITITLTPEQCNQMRDIFCKTLYLTICQWFVGFLQTELFYFDCSTHQQQQIENIEDIWKSILHYLNTTQQHKRFSNSGYAKGYSSSSYLMNNTNTRSPYTSIGMVDMYGFEDISSLSPETLANSFEQLLANYASEKMQHSFERYITQEQNFYYDEGIHWDTIEISNSCQLAIQLINGQLKVQKTIISSLVSVIDEISLSSSLSTSLSLSTASSSSGSSSSSSMDPTTEFASLLYLTFADSPAFSTSSLNKIKGEFTIRHYNQSVTYTVIDFLFKNQTYYFPLEDILAPSNNSCLRQYANVFSLHYGEEISPSSLLYHLRHKKETKGTVKSFFNLTSYSTSKLFCQGIDNLMTTLALTESHHVKCLLPTMQPSQPPQSSQSSEHMIELFSRNYLLSQLRAEGVLTALNIFAAVYPFQFSYNEFWIRFEPLITDVLTEERIHMATISEQIVYQSTNTTKKQEWVSVLSELENKMNCDGIALKKVTPRVADFSMERKKRLSLGRLSNNLVNELSVMLAALRSQGLGGGEEVEGEGEAEGDGMEEGFTQRKYLEADEDDQIYSQESSSHPHNNNNSSSSQETVIKISDDAKLSAGVDALISRYEKWLLEGNDATPSSSSSTSTSAAAASASSSRPQVGSSYHIQRGKTQIFMREAAFRWLESIDAKYLIPRRAAIVIQTWFRKGSFRTFVDHKYTRRKLFSRVVVPLQRRWRWKSQIYHQIIKEEQWLQKKKVLIEKNPSQASPAYSKQSLIDLYKHDLSEGEPSTSTLLQANRTVLWVIFSHYMDASVSKLGAIPIKKKFILPIVSNTSLCELFRDWGVVPQHIPLSNLEIFIAEAISRTSVGVSSSSSSGSASSSSSVSLSSSSKEMKPGEKKKKTTQNLISYTGFTIVLLLIAIELETHHHHSTPLNSTTIMTPQTVSEMSNFSILGIKESDVHRANPLEFCVRGLKIILNTMDNSKGRQKFISSRSSIIVPSFCGSGGSKSSLSNASPPVKSKDSKTLQVTPINTQFGNTNSSLTSSSSASSSSTSHSMATMSKRTPKEIIYAPMTPAVHEIIKKNELTLVAMGYSYGSNIMPPTSPQLQAHFSMESTPSNYVEFATLKTTQKREAVCLALEGMWNLLKDFEICPKFCSKSQLKEIFTTILQTHQIASSLGPGSPSSLSYTGYIEVLNCVAQNYMSRGSQEDKIRNMFYAMNMSTGRSKCVSNRLSGILPPLQIQSNPSTNSTVHTPTARGRDVVPVTTTSNLRHRRASTGTSILVRAHSRSVSPKSTRQQTPSPGAWLDSQNDNLLQWLAEVLKDDNGVKISHDALLDVHGAFQRAYITTVTALAAIPESDMTYSELKSLGIGPLGVRTMLLAAHKKLLSSRNHTYVPTPKLEKMTSDRRRGSEDSTSSTMTSTPITPLASRSAASQLFSKVSSISDSPENHNRIASPVATPTASSTAASPFTNAGAGASAGAPPIRPAAAAIPPQVKIIGNQIYVAVSKPLGMNLAENVPDEPLGVHIEKIILNGNASQCKVLRNGFILREVCGKNVMEMEFDDIMDILREAPFDTPLKMIFIDPMKTENGEDHPEEVPEEVERTATEATEEDEGGAGNGTGTGTGTGAEGEGEGEGDDEDVGRRSFSFEEDEEEKQNQHHDSTSSTLRSGMRPLLLRRKSSLT